MYTQLEIQMAALETARFLEANPERYKFFEFHKPDISVESSAYKGKACLLSWMGYFDLI